RGNAPGILTVEEEPRLRFIGVGGIADVTVKVTNIAEQETRQTGAAGAARSLSDVIREFELASPVSVARHAQVVRVPNVRTELDAVAATNIGPVIHKLILMFLFVEWAVALVGVKRIAEVKVGGAAGNMNLKTRHSGTVEIIEVQAGNSRVRSRT